MQINLNNEISTKPGGDLTCASPVTVSVISGWNKGIVSVRLSEVFASGVCHSLDTLVPVLTSMFSPQSQQQMSAKQLDNIIVREKLPGLLTKSLDTQNQTSTFLFST